MESLDIKTRAKINLYLEVIGKREDGYHNLDMIMQSINLYDNINIKIIKEDKIIIKTNSIYVPENHENICYKAGVLMKNMFNIKSGFIITIDKRIPVAAGLAGGSSNCAGVLKGINKLCNLNLDLDKLMEIGLKLGADVPFCLLEGCARARGVGEKLEKLNGLKHTWLIISKPNVPVSTKEVYEGLKPEYMNRNPIKNQFIDAIESGNTKFISQEMYNALEKVTLKLYPVIQDIKDKIIEYNGIGSMMSGSGPSVFGIYKDYNQGKKAYKKLKKLYNETYLVNTY